MKALVIGLLAVVLGGSLSLSAAGANEATTKTSTELVLSGNRSSFVDVQFRHPARLRCCAMGHGVRDGQMSFWTKGLEVRTRGTYGGFAIERLADGRLMKLAVRIPSMDLDDHRFPTVVTYGRARTLSAGWYRIHLLTDGAARVNVGVSGLGDSLRLRPTRPSPVAAELVALSRGPGEHQIQGRAPVEISPRSIAILATKTEARGAQAHLLSHCLAPRGGHCSDPDDYDAWLSPASGRAGGTEVDVHDRTVEPGTYDAVFSAASVGMSEGSYGFVLVLN